MIYKGLKAIGIFTLITALAIIIPFRPSHVPSTFQKYIMSTSYKRGEVYFLSHGVGYLKETQD